MYSAPSIKFEEEETNVDIDVAIIESNRWHVSSTRFFWIFPLFAFFGGDEIKYIYLGSDEVKKYAILNKGEDEDDDDDDDFDREDRDISFMDNDTEEETKVGFEFDPGIW